MADAIFVEGAGAGGERFGPACPSRYADLRSVATPAFFSTPAMRDAGARPSASLSALLCSKTLRTASSWRSRSMDDFSDSMRLAAAAACEERLRRGGRQGVMHASAPLRESSSSSSSSRRQTVRCLRRGPVAARVWQRRPVQAGSMGATERRRLSSCVSSVGAARRRGDGRGWAAQQPRREVRGIETEGAAYESICWTAS